MSNFTLCLDQYSPPPVARGVNIPQDANPPSSMLATPPSAMPATLATTITHLAEEAATSPVLEEVTPLVLEAAILARTVVVTVILEPEGLEVSPLLAVGITIARRRRCILDLNLNLPWDTFQNAPPPSNSNMRLSGDWHSFYGDPSHGSMIGLSAGNLVAPPEDGAVDASYASPSPSGLSSPRLSAKKM
ncbi:hypothetical protein BDV98DRAFT_598351 [Pterulicium gracile]|uniref:Uncharacterized protein n=1 Tax=Pterulicium gracile TaxID=1884261 RepID=A0A5C3Q0P5_9AGAR|nr:hypothetical protein BDV98DRAFT_598351 [Pterula gracilis]